MKKTVIILFLIVILLSLTTACGGQKGTAAQGGDTTVAKKEGASLSPQNDGNSTTAEKDVDNSVPQNDATTLSGETTVPVSVYRGEMEALLRVIENAINEYRFDELLDYIDPKYPRECFVVAELAGIMQKAYKDFIPAVSDVFSDSNPTKRNPTLSYVSDNINGTTGTLTYAISEIGNDSNNAEQTISVVDIDGRWYITCSIWNDYLYSILEEYIPWATDLASIGPDSLDRFQCGALFGLCTSEREEILRPCFTDIKKYVGGYCPVCVGNNKYGLLDNNGRLVVGYIFDEVFESPKSNYWWVSINGKWGAINFDTYSIVPLQFDEAYLFDYSDYVTVRKGEKWGVASADGRLQIPCEYDWIGWPDPKGNAANVYPAKKNGYYGVIDLDNNIVADFIYTDIEQSYNNGAIGVIINKHAGVLDETGNYIIRVSTDYSAANAYSTLIILRESGNYNSFSLFDHKGNPVLPGVLIDSSSVGLDSAIYQMNDTNFLVIAGGSSPFISDYSYSSDRTCYIVDENCNVIDLTPIIRASVISQCPEEYTKSKGRTTTGYEINKTTNPEIFRIIYRLAVSGTHSDYLYNYIDSSGTLLLKQWTVDRREELIDGYIVYTIPAQNKGDYDWYLVDIYNYEEYCLGTEPFTCWHNYCWKDEVQQLTKLFSSDRKDYYIIGESNSLPYKYAVLDINAKRVASLSEFIGVEYDIFLDDEIPIVSDGVFYGLLTPFGLVGDGIIYTDYDYDPIIGDYTLIRGTDIVDRYRILPDGSALKM